MIDNIEELYELILQDDEDGVFANSLVESPAIERDFVWLNKEVAFQSRELYVKCFNLYEHLLNAPSGLVDDRKNTKPKFIPPTPRATPRNATPRASVQNEEFVNRDDTYNIRYGGEIRVE